MARADTSGVPDDVRKAIVAEYFDDLRARKRAERMARQEGPPQPSTGRYKAISSGAYRRKQRPQMDVSDRQYVPAALRHWRQVHNLTQRQAQVRIGYSASAKSWSHWEQGFVAPPYRTLLAILAATGLGYWVDEEAAAGLGDLRLDARRAAHQQRAGRRRSRRAA
jgi:transcriptional regulator with XRE-family HTH domain